jgi:AAA family ATP:ADP antiporter
LNAPPNQRSEPAWLAQALRLISDVHRGEAVTVLLLTLNVFLLLSAYYVIKPVREALILDMASGAEYKSYMSGVIAISLFVLVPLYGKLVDRLTRSKLMIGVSLAFAAQLGLFCLLASLPSLSDKLGLIFYAWVGVFNVMVVAQFWGFANDLYDKEQGERLFPVVALGSGCGAVAGAAVAEPLIRRLGVPSMLLLAAGLLVSCAGLYFWLELRESSAKRGGAKPDEPQASSDKRGGFQLVLSHRYLLLLALFALVYNWVNSNGEYMLSKLLKAGVAAAVQRGEIKPNEVRDTLGAAYANFYFYVNLVGVLVQVFLVSRLVAWFKLPKVFLFLPVLAICNALVVGFMPIVALVKAGKTAENATDYSLNNTLRQMLWLVTSPQMKYKAKQVVDTFCVRIGDMCSALAVYLVIDRLQLSVQRFAWVSIVLGVIWLLLALAIGRHYEHGGASSEQTA